jgi:hypothetical protein
MRRSGWTNWSAAYLTRNEFFDTWLIWTQSLSGEALWAAALPWLPTAAVLAVTVLAVLAMLAQPFRMVKIGWLLIIVICGGAAVTLTAWERAASRTVIAEDTARLHELQARLDALGERLPDAPGRPPAAAETFDTVAAGIRSLDARINELDAQIRLFEEQAQARIIDRETVVDMADYLRGLGTHRVVVSTVPGDVEAFNYANQLVNILRAAGWEAFGPGRTMIHGDAPSIAVRIFSHGDGPPEATERLIEAFTRFNIPYQIGLAPTDAIPEGVTVELFVSHKS